jgi:glycerophosphoryl diester phosphodiesterase
MANSKHAVDWAVRQGANAIECDIHFQVNGNPHIIEHGPGCDCDCVKGNAHTCVPLQNKCSGPTARENPADYMKHIARHDSIALFFLDSKVSANMGGALVKAGKAIIPFMDNYLFGHGYKGKVVISSAQFDTFAYVQAAATSAKQSRNAHRYFFTIEGEGHNYAGVMKKLSPFTNNRVYGTGTSSCAGPHPFYAAIKAAVAGKKRRENGMNYIFTVDSEQAMREYINVGVEGIMTNQVPLAKKVAMSMGLKIARPDDPIPISTNGQGEYIDINERVKRTKSSFFAASEDSYSIRI